MFRSFIQAFLIYFLALGLVLPQSSGALAALGLSNGQYVVICAGDSLKTILLDDAGNPAEHSGETHDCALMNAVNTASIPALTVPKLRFLFDTELQAQKPQITVHQATGTALPRAPPTM